MKEVESLNDLLELSDKEFIIWSFRRFEKDFQFTPDDICILYKELNGLLTGANFLKLLIENKVVVSEIKNGKVFYKATGNV